MAADRTRRRPTRGGGAFAFSENVRVTHDVCVVGAGIVGLATAYALLQQRPTLDVVVLEKEATPGRHQTAHNSGVIHAGVYYPPGSFKADLCRRGAAAVTGFAREHGIPVETPGKLVVATSTIELDRMSDLHARARANGLEVERLDAAELHRREPAVIGLGALFVPSTGIVDYARVAAALAAEVRRLGGAVLTRAAVTAIDESRDRVRITAGGRPVDARHLVACAGLQADRVAGLARVATDFRIVPFRGEYYRLPPARDDLVRHLIYPVPDPALPFLGVHLTRMIDGGITVGPNAVLGLAREKYRKWSVDVSDLRDLARFPGLWRFARHNVRTGVQEFANSLLKRGYLRQCRRYCPSLTVDDLLPAEAGIRAQAMLRDGTLVHDFLWAETPRTLHVCNAPSPAATAALPIGELIAAKVLARH